MKRHIDVMRAIRADMLSKTPRFEHPSNTDENKKIRDFLSNATTAVSMEISNLKTKAKLAEEGENSEQPSTPTTPLSPKSPTRSVSPLTLQLFKPDIGPSVDSAIEIALKTSQTRLLENYPTLKPMYVILFVEKCLDKNPELESAKEFLKLGKNDEIHSTLQILIKKMSETRDKLQTLKEQPGKNIDEMLTLAHQYIQFESKVLDEWSKVRVASQEEQPQTGEIVAKGKGSHSPK